MSEVEMLHVGEVIPDDDTPGQMREIKYTKPPIEVGGVHWVWGRWEDTPFGVLEVFGPAEQVWPFFVEKKMQILANNDVRFGETIMG